MAAVASQPGFTQRMTSRKLFGRSRKPPPTPSSSELSSSDDTAGYVASHSRYQHNSGSHLKGHAHRTSDNVNDGGEKVFGSRDTNFSTSALSTTSTASRTSRFFRRFARQKPPPVPSLPPALVLDLDAGHALPRSSDPASANVVEITQSRTAPSQTPAAAIIAESQAAYALASTLPIPTSSQRKKTLDAITNARLDVAPIRDLVRMCGLQIRERGLDTPGVFRPFRIAESPDRVLHMIQLFLLSIDTPTYIAVFPILPENALDRLERIPSSSSSYEEKSRVARQELDKELRYANPHDVVSVLKWGLRHMRLRASDFHSKDADEWYDNFVTAERESGYHPRAIADLLHPKLPLATAELLSEVLDLMASVAAHSSSNHMPASSLCRVVGFWMLGRIGVAHPPPNLDELIQAVNRAAGMSEHLLLAHIRSQAAVTFSMPLRLTELVQSYPYIKSEGGRGTPGLEPAFASRTVPTLRVDLRSENFIVSQAKPRLPSATLADALQAKAADGIKGGKGEMWASVIMQAMDGKGYELLIDEHVRILSKVDEVLSVEGEEGKRNSILVDAANASAPATATASSATPAISSADIKNQRRRSQSLSDLCSNFVLAPTSQNRPLAPLQESGTTTPRKSSSSPTKPPPPPPFASTSTPKRKPVPLLNPAHLVEAGEEVEVISENPHSHYSDLFTGGLETSSSWKSFSEEGFNGSHYGLMSTASSDLSLSEFPISPISPLPSRKSQRSLYRVRSSISRKNFTPLVLEEKIEVSVKKNCIITNAVMEDVDGSLAILWQDQLLDFSPCSNFPSMVLVQFNDNVKKRLREEEEEKEKKEGRFKGEVGALWLLIGETIIPPRPPTPTKREKGKGWDQDSEIGAGGGRTKSIWGGKSIKSVKMRLRRVSTVVGIGGRSR